MSDLSKEIFLDDMSLFNLYNKLSSHLVMYSYQLVSCCVRSDNNATVVFRDNLNDLRNLHLHFNVHSVTMTLSSWGIAEDVFSNIKGILKMPL